MRPGVLAPCRVADESSYAPWVRGPDLGVRDGAGSRARAVALVRRLTFGGHPDAERCPALRAGHRAAGRWDGTVLRTKVRGARSRAPCGRLCATDGAPPSDGRLALCPPGRARRVPSVSARPRWVRWRGACSGLTRRARAPHPPSPHRGVSDAHRPLGWLRGLPNYVAI